MLMNGLGIQGTEDIWTYFFAADCAVGGSLDAKGVVRVNRSTFKPSMHSLWSNANLPGKFGLAASNIHGHLYEGGYVHVHIQAKL